MTYTECNHFLNGVSIKIYTECNLSYVLPLLKMEKNQSLPALRKICGLTQAEMAAQISVSTRTIVAIENGTRPLTEANARKITFATGVRSDSLMTEDSPRALNGEPYTRDHWELWKNPPERGFPDVPSHVESVRDAIQERFENLLKATFESGPGPVFLLADEFSAMLGRMLGNSTIEQRYSKLMPSESLESLERIVEDGLIWALWEAEDMNKPEDPFGDPLGIGYTEGDD